MANELDLAAKPHEVATVTEAPGSLLAAIVGLAKDPAVDVAKLEALLQMQERMEARQGEVEFNRAMMRLPEFRVKKNGTIDLTTKEGQKKGSIPFARWEDMCTLIEPALRTEGFRLLFDSQMRSADGGGLVVTGTLLHRDGHSRSATMPLALDTGPGRNNLQAMGSTLSYGKRYTAEMLLNIVREGQDDDGKMGGTRFIAAEQVTELRDLIAKTHSDEARFLQFFGIAYLEGLELGAYAAARNMLLAKQRPPAS